MFEGTNITDQSNRKSPIEQRIVAKFASSPTEAKSAFLEMEATSPQSTTVSTSSMSQQHYSTTSHGMKLLVR